MEMCPIVGLMEENLVPNFVEWVMVCLNIHRETKQYKLAGVFLITIDREAKEKIFSFLETDAFLHKFFFPWACQY